MGTENLNLLRNKVKKVLLHIPCSKKKHISGIWVGTEMAKRLSSQLLVISILSFPFFLSNSFLGFLVRTLILILGYLAQDYHLSLIMNNSRDCFLLLEMLHMVFLLFLLISSDYFFSSVICGNYGLVFTFVNRDGFV